MATLIFAPTRLLQIILAMLIAWAPLAGAASKGVPISITPPSEVSRKDELAKADIQTKITHLERFRDQADDYIRAVQFTIEKYRDDLEKNKALWAACETKVDLGGYATSRFSGMADLTDADCLKYANEMEQITQIVAADLDEAIRFQKEVLFYEENVVIPGIETYRLVQQRQRLATEIQRGREAVQEARRGFEPWMN